jgi:hypothetical protein
LLKEQTEALTHSSEPSLTERLVSDLRSGRLYGDARLALVQNVAFRSCEAKLRQARRRYGADTGFE